MRFSVESWSPEYGIAADQNAFEEAANSVDATIERPLDQWSGIQPPRQEAPARVLFVDGVRRIDARVWIHDGQRSHVGVCASVAAGAVECSSTASAVIAVNVGRGIFAPAASGATSVVTKHATYEYRPTTSDEPQAIYNGIHELMTELEMSAAIEHSADLVVFDGPLRGRNDPIGVGYIKTQQVQYLPDEVVPILGQLGDGERTPLMLIGGHGFTRFSWYLRLPGPRTQPLAGIVRLELPAVGPITAAIARAEIVSACLPRFASEPHKEPRAPQNLYPIAGLENQLRHRLGDALLLERSLRIEAAASTKTIGAVGPADTAPASD